MTVATPKDVLEFWFRDATRSPEALERRGAVWFQVDPVFDRECATRFAVALEDAARGALDGWERTPNGRLALVVLLDQMPRNIHRGSPAAFAHDAQAAANCIAAIESGQDRVLHLVERIFLYMPLQHAEDLELQRRSIRQFESLAAEADDAWRGYFAENVRYARASITTSSSASGGSLTEIVSSAGSRPTKSGSTSPTVLRRSVNDRCGRLRRGADVHESGGTSTMAVEPSTMDRYVLRKHGIHMASGEYPDDQFPTTYSLKDLRYALELAERTDVDARGAKVVEERFVEAIDKGFGHLYSPVLYRLLDR